MTRFTQVLRPILLILLTVSTGISFAQTPAPAKPNNEAVWITADGGNSYQGAVATADDNAACHFQDYTLTADHLTYNRITKTVQGTGNAKLIDAKHGSTILGYQITVPDCESKLLKHILVSLCH
jgi:lipopolysaccharide assembly outer membrane protein LptD (OstA)